MNDLLPQLKARSTDKPEKGKLYLHMIHGRTNPNQQMDDWGTDGPFIGPLNWCHFTYNSTINLGFSDGFGFYEDMLFFDGVYYGDWELQIAG